MPHRNMYTFSDVATNVRGKLFLDGKSEISIFLPTLEGFLPPGKFPSYATGGQGISGGGHSPRFRVRMSSGRREDEGLNSTLSCEISV